MNSNVIKTIILLLDIIAYRLFFVEGCVFYDKNGIESELETTKFIRIRENLRIGDEILNVRAYPRKSVFIKGTSENADHVRYFKLKTVNETNIQVLLDRSIDDLVDRDVPQNVLKFKIECMSKSGRVEETSFLTVNVYIEDVNDHAPEFENLPYITYVDESTSVGAKIFTGISAFDRDQPHTPNSDVQYSIDLPEQDAHFSLESPHRPHIILRRALDFDEGKRMFEIPIVATDRGDHAKSSTATLMIMVKDSDDLPPKFTESIYRTKINEFSPITGQRIKMPLSFSPPIMAYDQDSLNTTLIYDIISGNDRNLFTINANTGIIYLTTEIDLEEETLPGNTFVLQIEARQKDTPIKRAVARVEIEIVDLNDNQPEFEVEFYNISIVENLPSGFSVLQVNALDRDQGENADFLYIISKESPEGAFLIDPRTGWITVRDQELLDREVRTKIRLTIEAVEKIEPYGKKNQKPSSVEIEITLLDANDNTPSFDMGNLYEFKVNQQAPIGHIVGYITAKDPDEGRNGMILYELQQPKGGGHVPFRLDSKTGALIVSNTLKKGRLAIFVEASDQPANPSERRFSLAVVTIEVVAKVFVDGSLDFIGAPYEFWVGANAPIGYSVGHIKTNFDWDGGEYVMYDLLHSYSEGVPFAVEERSGIVTVIRDLADYDRKLYEFEAVAAHFSPEKPRSNANHLTKHTSKSGRQITKNGDVFELEQGIVTDNENVLITNVTVHVVNPDEEAGILMRGTTNDPIEFHIRENLADAMIGQLIYKNVTREERNRSVNPAPSASAMPSMTAMNLTARHERYLNSRFNKSKMKIKKGPSLPYKRTHRHVNLEDQFYVSVTPSVFYNDEDDAADAVAFESETMTVAATAYHPVTTRSVVTVTSRTSSSTATTKTAPTTEHIMTHDMTTLDNFLDDISSKRRSNTSTTSKVILVTPRPLLRKSNNEKVRSFPDLQNLTRAGKQVVNRRRFESNNNNNNNSNKRGLRFVIANQHDVNNMITITNDGTLMTKKPLDREERDVYHLTIIAEYVRQGYVTGAGIYQVVIYVDDENDNPPVFNMHSYSGSIIENCAINTEVTFDQQMLVHDADMMGENSIFDLTLQGEGSNFFTIERRKSPSTSLVNQFTSAYSIGNQRFARALSKIHAAANKNGSNNILDDLNVVPQYAIRYIGPNVIDREIQSYYEFNVVARDKGGLSSEVKFTLYILDTNDCAPIFDKLAIFKDASIEVLEYPNDLKVYFVDRSEPDTLTYPIRHHVRNVQDDQLMTSATSNINYEIMQLADGQHIGTPRQMNNNMRLNATHTSPSSRSRSRRRNFEKPYAVFSILESIEVGNTVLRLTATDDDYENNAQVTYKIVSQSHTAPRSNAKQMLTNKLFGIDESSGELRVIRPLPAQSEIILNVSAIDTGGLSDTTLIKFKVIDINNNAPVFEKSWYSYDISEGYYMHMVIGKIVATDEDYGDNANITYSLLSNDTHPFYITPLTGILKVNGELDREQKALYEFKVVASDNSKKEPQMRSTVEIEINILDVNDNSPTFTGFDEMLTLNGGYGRRISDADEIIESINDEDLPYNLPVYKAYLNRNTEPGTFVKQITAIDKDFSGNGNGLVMYALRHNSLPYFFEIDSRDGVITTIARFNRYQSLYEHINLTIIASDLGTPSKSSVALLIVNLQGTASNMDNDYDDMVVGSSLFQHKYYEIEVPENNVVPTMLLQINATHMHREKSFKWSITTESAGRNREFRIDPHNGTLWLVRSLDREMEDTYRLKVRADPVYRESRASIMYPITDDRIGDLMDNEVRIVVRVKDENDNDPKFSGNFKPIVAVIPNTANFGYPVTRVEATDDDIGVNAEIRYSLLNEPTKLFEIDEMSGNIRVIGPINNDQRVYGFDVKATDRKGAEDGRSSIVNVFVYILDDSRNVRLVIAGTPVDIERDLKNLTKSLSDLTSFDVRIRMLEPHMSDNYQPATDVYLYAVDPRSNTVVDMDVLQSKMGSIPMSNLTISSRILGLAELGEYQSFNAKIPQTNYKGSNLKTSELATIILAIVVFTGGLATAFCVVCVRYKRDRQGGQRGHGRHDFIDVPLSQPTLSANFNLMDHENRCIKYNPLQHQNQNVNNLDTSVPSIHSSGCDSGVGLTTQINVGSNKQLVQLMRSSQRETLRDRMLTDKRAKRCVCGYAAAGAHVCNAGEESSDSYEDSLKNVSCLRISRRTSFPKTNAFRSSRSLRSHRLSTPRDLHPFSGVI